MTGLWQRSAVDDRALVLVFAGSAPSIWDRAISRLIDEVEERVDAGCVTFALLNGRQPSVRDALAAARLAGCTSAVLAVVDSPVGAPLETDLPRLYQGMPVGVASCGRDARSVAAVFGAAGPEVAACA